MTDVLILGCPQNRGSTLLCYVHAEVQFLNFEKAKISGWPQKYPLFRRVTSLHYSPYFLFPIIYIEPTEEEISEPEDDDDDEENESTTSTKSADKTEDSLCPQ